MVALPQLPTVHRDRGVREDFPVHLQGHGRDWVMTSTLDYLRNHLDIHTSPNLGENIQNRLESQPEL